MQEKAWFRWGFATLMLAVAAAANSVLQPLVGQRAPLLPFFPALMAIGLVSGVWPSVSALIGSALVVATWSVEPYGRVWPINQPSDVVLLVAFLCGGSIAIAVSCTTRNVLAQYRRTRSRLDMTLSVGHMASWEWDIRNRKMLLGPRAEEVFGTRWRQVDEAWALVAPDDRERVKALVEAALQGTENRYSFLSRWVRPDTGEARWLESFGNIVRDKSGQAMHVTGITVDVDGRQRLLDASRTAEQRFEAALRGSGIIVWECDTALRYTWVRNPQLGFKVDDFVGRKMGELLPREQAQRFHDAAERVAATGKGENVVVDVAHAGQTQYYISTLDAMTDDQGRFRGLIGTSMNITDLKATQIALQQEILRKDNFLATLSHELRNPLASIRYAAALWGKTTSEQAREHARAVIERQSAHLGRLLDDLLDMSRITRNVIELDRSRVDLRTVVDQAIETAHPLLTSRRHAVTACKPDEPLWVDGDITRLLQIVGNLLDNAAKYTPPGGGIKVSVERVAGEAVLIVHDTGVGLSQDQLDNVFQLFARLHKPGDVDPGGLGIGLAVVKQLVELHGGHVRAESEGIGKGSSFIVRLPLDTRPTDVAPALPAPQQLLHNPDRGSSAPVAAFDRPKAT